MTVRTDNLPQTSPAVTDAENFMSTTYQVCTEWRNAVLDELARDPPDVVIVGSAATYPFTEGQWIEGSTRVLARLNQIADAVILIPGTPSLGFNGPGCVARNLSEQGSIRLDACQAPNRLSHVEPVRHYLEKSAAQFSNVHVLDLNDLVCPEGLCNAVSQDGLLVFRDSQHLTDRFVRARLPMIDARLKTLIPEP
ncbi:MAG: hypothetical protein EOM20_21725 [Spartobacteria bacterium]|nr:hypothetical protein [Spartobacteria bacterium]